MDDIQTKIQEFFETHEDTVAETIRKALSKPEPIVAAPDDGMGKKTLYIINLSHNPKIAVEFNVSAVIPSAPVDKMMGYEAEEIIVKQSVIVRFISEKPIKHGLYKIEAISYEVDEFLEQYINCAATRIYIERAFVDLMALGSPDSSKFLADANNMWSNRDFGSDTLDNMDRFTRM